MEGALPREVYLSADNYAKMLEDTMDWDRENFPAEQQYWDTKSTRKNVRTQLLEYYERYPEATMPSPPVKLRRVAAPAFLPMPTPELEELSFVYRSTWFRPFPLPAQ